MRDLPVGTGVRLEHNFESLGLGLSGRLARREVARARGPLDLLPTFLLVFPRAFNSQARTADADPRRRLKLRSLPLALALATGKGAHISHGRLLLLLMGMHDGAFDLAFPACIARHRSPYAGSAAVILVGRH